MSVKNRLVFFLILLLITAPLKAGQPGSFSVKITGGVDEGPKSDANALSRDGSGTSDASSAVGVSPKKAADVPGLREGSASGSLEIGSQPVDLTASSAVDPDSQPSDPSENPVSETPEDTSKNPSGDSGSESDTSGGSGQGDDETGSGDGEIVTEGVADGEGMETGEGTGWELPTGKFDGSDEKDEYVGPKISQGLIKEYGDILAETDARPASGGTGLPKTKEQIAKAEEKARMIMWPGRIVELMGKLDQIRAEDMVILFRNPCWLDQRRGDGTSIGLYLRNRYGLQLKYEGSSPYPIKIFNFWDNLEATPMARPKKDQ